METLDLNSLKANLDSINSAFAASLVAKQNEDAHRIARAVSEQNARRDAKMVAGAEASVAQKELMEEQLVELKSQNDILSEQLKAEQAQRAILEEHLKVTTEQNGLLTANYQKLEEMYNAQKESNDEARKDLHKSRVFNAWMMVIAIVAMLAAIAGPIVTVLVSR
jgi:hypothetical protein